MEEKERRGGWGLITKHFGHGGKTRMKTFREIPRGELEKKKGGAKIKFLLKEIFGKGRKWGMEEIPKGGWKGGFMGRTIQRGGSRRGIRDWDSLALRKSVERVGKRSC